MGIHLKIQACLCAYGGQRSTSNVFSDGSLLNFLRQDLSETRAHWSRKTEELKSFCGFPCLCLHPGARIPMWATESSLKCVLGIQTCIPTFMHQDPYLQSHLASPEFPLFFKHLQRLLNYFQLNFSTVDIYIWFSFDSKDMMNYFQI